MNHPGQQRRQWLPLKGDMSSLSFCSSVRLHHMPSKMKIVRKGTAQQISGTNAWLESKDGNYRCTNRASNWLELQKKNCTRPDRARRVGHLEKGLSSCGLGGLGPALSHTINGNTDFCDSWTIDNRLSPVLPWARLFGIL